MWSPELHSVRIAVTSAAWPVAQASAERPASIAAMNGQELATAVQYGAAFVALVVNNGLYGTIRMHQEREYPGRVFGTDLKNPDFAAYARAFGGHGETVERTEDFAPAYERASASGKPAIIELKIDPDAITPATTLSAIREKAAKSRLK